jgi:hypothetical protein
LPRRNPDRRFPTFCKTSRIIARSKFHNIYTDVDYRVKKKQVMFKFTNDEDLMPEGTKVRRLSYYLKTREERE